MASQGPPVNGAVLHTAGSVEIAEPSQTASEFIQSQLQLEADAREALPYQFDTCTKDLGPLRQNLFSCLTCNPPPLEPSQLYQAAGICYACSISCHGEHELVELFTRRNFVCDCGTTRLPSSSICTLRLDAATGLKGNVHDDVPASTNTYNQNFQNRFCGCGEAYDAYTEKGTMFQCLGLGSVVDGGCGEDWWHPECLIGLKRDWYQKTPARAIVEETQEQEQDHLTTIKAENTVHQPTISEDATQEHHEEIPLEDEHPLPPGFPAEDDFEHLICYKCTAAYPWIKRYAGASGFLSALVHKPVETVMPELGSSSVEMEPTATVEESPASPSKKRRASDHDRNNLAADPPKRLRQDSDTNTLILSIDASAGSCTWSFLPQPPSSPITLFLKADFRDHFCRQCLTCFPRLAPHAQLLEEEEVYEPPQSEDGSEVNDIPGSVHSAGSRSLLGRGEAALNNVDRVRAIEGVMAYNHLRDKVKDFLKPFAESGQVVGAEDIKKYFEKLRGDEEAIRTAGMGNGEGGSGQ